MTNRALCSPGNPLWLVDIRIEGQQPQMYLH